GARSCAWRRSPGAGRDRRGAGGLRRTVTSRLGSPRRRAAPASVTSPTTRPRGPAAPPMPGPPSRAPRIPCPRYAWCARARLPSLGASRDIPVLPDDYEELRALVQGCTRCALAEGRTQVVFSDGSPSARLMVVGEAPGATEDDTGLPFVGAAGRFLDLLLATV